MGAAPLFDGAHLRAAARPGSPARHRRGGGAAGLGRGPRLRGQRRHSPALPARATEHADHRRRRRHRHPHAEGRVAGDRRVRALRQQLADAPLLRAPQGLELRSDLDLAERHRPSPGGSRGVLRRRRRLAGARGDAARRHRLPPPVPARRSALHAEHVPAGRAVRTADGAGRARATAPPPALCW